MPYGAFLADVRSHGGYDASEAEAITEAVVGALGERLSPEVAEHLGEQLPPPLAEVLANAPAQARDWGAEGFCAHLAGRLGVRSEAAEEYARTVLSVLAERISGGELNKLLSLLPSGYAALFGHPELAG